MTELDFRDEQLYHRQNLYRHAVQLHGHGIVQGLSVKLQQRKGGYIATIDGGYGITRSGQGVFLSSSRSVRLDIPTRDGQYMFWLFHVESNDTAEVRHVFDSSNTQSARIIEGCAPGLKPEGQEYQDGIELCRINVRMGRMVKVEWPVPRAGRQDRAAESELKPKLSSFISHNKKIISLLLRTQKLRDVELPTLSFNAALISAEFLLIEEGTSDRVLYRTTGSLIEYADAFYSTQPITLDRLERFRDFIRITLGERPNITQNNNVWHNWFIKFEQLLKPLKDLSDELVRTIGPQR